MSSVEFKGAISLNYFMVDLAGPCNNSVVISGSPLYSRLLKEDCSPLKIAGFWGVEEWAFSCFCNSSAVDWTPNFCLRFTEKYRSLVLSTGEKTPSDFKVDDY